MCLKRSERLTTLAIAKNSLSYKKILRARAGIYPLPALSLFFLFLRIDKPHGVFLSNGFAVVYDEPLDELFCSLPRLE